MTDDLLKKLEEKMMLLLAELENLRKESRALRQENQVLKNEYGNHVKKLQSVVSLLDSLDTPMPSARENDFMDEPDSFVTA
jgi:regulator of replication initiation timing